MLCLVTCKKKVALDTLRLKPKTPRLVAVVMYEFWREQQAGLSLAPRSVLWREVARPQLEGK